MKAPFPLIFLLLNQIALFNVFAKNVDEDLLTAAKAGHVTGVREALNRGADVNAKDGTQSTALLWASQDGHIEIVKILLEAKAKQNLRDSFNKSPLMRAAANGHLDIVKLLIKGSAGPNQMTNDVRAAQAIAFEAGYVEICKVLAQTIKAQPVANRSPEGQCDKTLPEIDPKESQLSYFLSPGVGLAWLNTNTEWQRSLGFDISLFSQKGSSRTLFGGYFDGYSAQNAWRVSLGPELVYVLVTPGNHFSRMPIFIGLDGGYMVRDIGRGAEHGASLRAFINPYLPVLAYIRSTYIFSPNPANNIELGLLAKWPIPLNTKQKSQL